MKRILKHTWKAVRHNLGNLLLFETGYRILTFFLTMQIIEKAVDISLKHQGFSYLTAENYGEFIKSPWTILLFLGAFAVLLLFFLIEASALLWGFQHSAAKRKLYASDFFIEGLKGVLRLLRQRKFLWIFWAALSVPFLSACFLVLEASYVGLLEFTAREIYQTVTPHGLLYLFLAILLLISGCSVFALPYCFLESEKSLAGIGKGIHLLKKRWKLILRGGVILYLILAVIGAAFYLLTTVGITGAVMLLRPEEGKITSVLIYKEYIHMAMGVFAGGLQMIGSLAFVYAVYSRFHRQKNEDVPLCRLGDEAQKQLLRHSILCNDSTNKNGEEIGDPTETALINLGDKLGCPAETIREKYPRCSEVPFDSDRKLMSTLHNLKNGCTMVTKGAVDVLLGRVSHIQKNGEVCPITEEDKRIIEEQNQKFSRNGLRVLAFGYKKFEEARTLSVEDENDLTFLGLIAMMDPPREESKEAVAECIRAGIKPIMITGDHKVTAAAIAKRIGILKDESEACEGAVIENMTDEEL